MSDGDINPQDFIFDSDHSNFESLVLENSEHSPVLVHFWSHNSDLGFSLQQLLEQLILSYSGSFLLVNLDSDQNRNICVDYNISSTPTIKLYVDRKVVETLTGYQNEQDIRFMLDQYLASEHDITIRDALSLYDQGNKDAAYQMLGQAALQSPRYYKLPLTMASLLQSDKKFEQALKLIDSLPPRIQKKSLVQRIVIELEFAWIAEPVKVAHELEAFTQNHPEELSAIAMLASWHVTQKQYAEALGLFHQIMQQDRNFEADIGRRSMLKILSLLKQDDPLIHHYRNLIKT